MNNKVSLLIILSLLILVNRCSIKTGPADKNDDKLSYELVEGWPQLSQGYVLSQPTGIGIGYNDHIFVFHRTGRRWTDPFPDSLISMNTILELDNQSGKILNSWGANYFIMPHGLTVDNDNNIWVTDVALHQVFKFDHEGKLLMKLGVPKVPGNDSLHFNLPTDVAVGSDGSIYVSDGYGNSRVVKFSSLGKYLLEWGTLGDKIGEFDTPHGITIDKKDNVYVADRQNNRIQMFNSNGQFIKVLKNSRSAPQLPSVTIDIAQNIFAIDFDYTSEPDSVVKGSTIFRYDSSGNAVFQFGGSGTDNRTVSWYHDISVDRQGNIYVGDIIAKRVLKFKLKTTVTANEIK